MPHDYFWQWHTWWIFPIIMPIFWVIMIGLCLYFIFRRRRSNRTREPARGPEGETALDILKKRYASGEINKDGFERMKRDIMG
jgi:putative membrane protein